tara:strand:- start:320 stop:442 length:123 start_codon:yes stop_codon:yes gene_type:complete
MQKNKPQQFAKFFLKDIKKKSLVNDNDKYTLDEFNLSTQN